MRSILKFRGIRSALVLTTWAVTALACSSEAASDDEGLEDCEQGTERCDCYRNDSCDDGLMCVSDVCVKKKSTTNSPGVPGRQGGATGGKGSTDPTDESPNEAQVKTPEQQELKDGTVGAACGECDGGLVCIPDVPGGYCTAPCGTNADCGAHGACVAEVCYRVCDADADCRPSYACTNLGDVTVCDEDLPEAGSDRETGSCGNTCEHYLTCKGIFDSETQQICTNSCAKSGYASDELALFQATDCETAIQAIEGSPSQAGGSGSGSGGVDCTNCYKDGSSCVYLSEYTLVSTAGFTCDASCCN